MENILFGCVADDFTGASDAASFLQAGGLSTVLYNGIPTHPSTADAQAMVIALKTRTQETTTAVADTLAAVDWLYRQGVNRLYIKYCSTFDSTPKGNIGPILDAILEKYHIPYTVLCPALPVNGRTVRQGELFVDGTPLHKSSMRNHPLTPMWDSHIGGLMKPQSKYPCHTTDRFTDIDKVCKGENAPHFYLIPDFEVTDDGAYIAQTFGDLPMLSGGSGLLEPLARYYGANATATPVSPATKGKGLLLAGSCSFATRGQIKAFEEQGGRSIYLDAMALLEGRQTVDTLWQEMQSQEGDVLVYSSSDPEIVSKIQAHGAERVAEQLEQTMAAIAKRGMDAGYSRIIVAGGETSGAVTKGLGFTAYHISQSVAAGVPVMVPIHQPQVRLVLKSGNFGQRDFFTKALWLTKEDV